MVLQTYSPPSQIDLVEKTTEEKGEDDPDRETDCGLLYDDEVYSENTMYWCSSFIHCMYSFCSLAEVHCTRFLSQLFGYQ